MNHNQIKLDGIESIQTIRLDLQRIPKETGIYCILLPEKFRIEFLEQGTGGAFKKRNPNVSLEELKNNWVEGTDILYIGKTDDSLRTRISAYLKFGDGKPIGHWGGRYIWQLANSQELLVGWKALPTEGGTGALETQYLRQFYQEHGKLPFANLKIS